MDYTSIIQRGKANHQQLQNSLKTRHEFPLTICYGFQVFWDDKKVQVGKDQENAQSEKDSHSKNRGGKKQTNNQVLIP